MVIPCTVTSVSATTVPHARRVVVAVTRSRRPGSSRVHGAVSQTAVAHRARTTTAQAAFHGHEESAWPTDSRDTARAHEATVVTQIWGVGRVVAPGVPGEPARWPRALPPSRTRGVSSLAHSPRPTRAMTTRAATRTGRVRATSPDGRRRHRRLAGRTVRTRAATQAAAVRRFSRPGSWSAVSRSGSRYSRSREPPRATAAPAARSRTSVRVSPGRMSAAPAARSVRRGTNAPTRRADRAHTTRTSTVVR